MQDNTSKNLSDVSESEDLPEKTLANGRVSGARLPAAADDFPEGGWTAWATLIGGWLVQFCTFGYANAFGVYQDYYVRVYLNELSSSQISWIGSIQLCLVLAGGLVSGRAFDRGYFHHIMIFGSVLFVFCLFMLSLAKPHQYYQIFLSQGLGLGIASGLTFVPSVGIIAHHFKRRRTLAMAIAASGSSLGGVLHPIMLNNLFHGKAGFAKGVRASAGLNLGLLVIANLLMRTRLPPRNVGKLGPALKKFARDGAYVLAVSGTVFVIIGLFFPIFYIQLDAIEHGIDSTFAFYTVALLNSGSFLGRILPGFIARFVGVLQMQVICTLIASVLIFVLLAVKTVAGFTVFPILYGVFSGAYVTLLGPMLAVLSDDVSEIGARMGICYTFTGLGSLIGSPIQGALLTGKFIWWRPAVFSGVFTGIGSACFAISAILLRRKRMRQSQLKENSSFQAQKFQSMPASNSSDKELGLDHQPVPAT